MSSMEILLKNEVRIYTSDNLDEIIQIARVFAIICDFKYVESVSFLAELECSGRLLLQHER